MVSVSVSVPSVSVPSVSVPVPVSAVVPSVPVVVPVVPSVPVPVPVIPPDVGAIVVPAVASVTPDVLLPFVPSVSVSDSLSVVVGTPYTAIAQPIISVEIAAVTSPTTPPAAPNPAPQCGHTRSCDFTSSAHAEQRTRRTPDTSGCVMRSTAPRPRPRVNGR